MITQSLRSVNCLLREKHNILYYTDDSRDITMFNVRVQQTVRGTPFTRGRGRSTAVCGRAATARLGTTGVRQREKVAARGRRRA